MMPRMPPVTFSCLPPYANIDTVYILIAMMLITPLRAAMMPR